VSSIKPTRSSTNRALLWTVETRNVIRMVDDDARNDIEQLQININRL